MITADQRRAYLIRCQEQLEAAEPAHLYIGYVGPLLCARGPGQDASDFGGEGGTMQNRRTVVVRIRKALIADNGITLEANATTCTLVYPSSETLEMLITEISTTSPEDPAYRLALIAHAPDAQEE